MKDRLPNKPWKNESMIINLDNSDSTGTHWVALTKKNNEIFYYDSFRYEPPDEVFQYLGPKADINYEYEKDQKLDQVICGHLCLKFLLSFLL